MLALARSNRTFAPCTVRLTATTTTTTTTTTMISAPASPAKRKSLPKLTTPRRSAKSGSGLPPSVKQAAAETASPAKRRLFDNARAVPTAAAEEPAEKYLLQHPDGSAWSTTVWEAAVAFSKLLLSNAEQLAAGHPGTAKAVAAMRQASKDMQKGTTRGSKRKVARSELCKRFCCSASAVAVLIQNNSLLATPCLPSVVQQAMETAYKVAVTNPRALNKYKPFSHEVYGETNANLVQHVITSQQITAADTFFDLGSGIGQVVLQVAASTGCRAIGVELMDNPAEYASAMGPAFAKALEQWGWQLPHPTTLIHGDFLKDCPQLSEATVIFINNFAFPVALSQALGAHISTTCRPGTRVLTYKPIMPMGRRTGRRNNCNTAATEVAAAAAGAGEQRLVEVSREVSPDDG